MYAVMATAAYPYVIFACDYQATLFDISGSISIAKGSLIDTGSNIQTIKMNKKWLFITTISTLYQYALPNTINGNIDFILFDHKVVNLGGVSVGFGMSLLSNGVSGE